MKSRKICVCTTRAVAADAGRRESGERIVDGRWPSETERPRRAKRACRRSAARACRSEGRRDWRAGSRGSGHACRPCAGLSSGVGAGSNRRAGLDPGKVEKIREVVCSVGAHVPIPGENGGRDGHSRDQGIEKLQRENAKLIDDLNHPGPGPQWKTEPPATWTAPPATETAGSDAAKTWNKLSDGQTAWTLPRTGRKGQVTAGKVPDVARRRSTRPNGADGVSRAAPSGPASPRSIRKNSPGCVPSRRFDIRSAAARKRVQGRHRLQTSRGGRGATTEMGVPLAKVAGLLRTTAWRSPAASFILHELYGNSAGKRAGGHLARQSTRSPRRRLRHLADAANYGCSCATAGRWAKGVAQSCLNHLLQRETAEAPLQARCRSPDRPRPNGELPTRSRSLRGRLGPGSVGFDARHR